MIDDRRTWQPASFKREAGHRDVRVGAAREGVTREGKQQSQPVARRRGLIRKTPGALAIMALQEMSGTYAAIRFVKQQAVRTNRLIAVVFDDRGFPRDPTEN